MTLQEREPCSAHGTGEAAHSTLRTILRGVDGARQREDRASGKGFGREVIRTLSMKLAGMGV
jgi:hypothetical protein